MYIFNSIYLYLYTSLYLSLSLSLYIYIYIYIGAGRRRRELPSGLPAAAEPTRLSYVTMSQSIA